MNAVDVSVIIPTYNRARLVKEAIESVLGQTTPPREIIVIDDGSTDDTPRILEEFKGRIVYLRQENSGAGVARNRGLSRASGRYLAFLDSDDLWLDFKLELQTAVLDRLPEIGFVCSDFVIVRNSVVTSDRGLRTWHRDAQSWDQIFETSINYSSLGGPRLIDDFRIYSGSLYRALLAEPYVLPSSAVVRADTLATDIRFTEGVPVYEDWEFFARLARRCRAGFLDVVTTINRGGSDRARLTQCAPATKAECRARMIERVWRHDDEFMAAHRPEVDAVEADQWLQLARCRVLESDRAKAREALRQWAALRYRKQSATALALATCAFLPGSGAALRGARRVAGFVRTHRADPGRRASDVTGHA